MSDITIKDYIERRFDEVEKRYDQRFTDLHRAIDKAEHALSLRLAGMNEFREALKDQANRMATISDLEKVDQAVRHLQNAKANLDGRLLGIVATVSAIVSFLIAMLGLTVSR